MDDQYWKTRSCDDMSVVSIAGRGPRLASVGVLSNKHIHDRRLLRQLYSLCMTRKQVKSV